MKKTLLLATLLAWVISVSSASFTVNGINYTTTGANSVGVSSGIVYTGNIIIPSSISYSGTSYNVTSIGSSAFYNCIGLTSVTIPSSVTSIDTYAFMNCTGLANVTIFPSVISIGSSAFTNCINLANIYSYINPPTDLVNYQFTGVNMSTCKLNVPSGTRSLYQAALGWKDFLNIIEPVATDINQAKATQLTVAPTIATSTITIQTKGSNFSQSLRIFNAQGQLLYETNLVESKVGVDVSNFPVGTYYIKTIDKNNGDQGVGKFIKK